MAAIIDTLGTAVDKLKTAVQDTAPGFPPERITYKALIGNYIKTLKALTEEEQAVLIIIGTPAAFGEIWSWDTDTLSAMTELPVPVLAVPQDVVYSPLKTLLLPPYPATCTALRPYSLLKNWYTIRGPGCM